MYRAIYILSFLILVEGSPVYETVVDQSQSGDLNVEVSLKNVEIIALLNRGSEQYTDYDYNYDYTEMTIKPPNKTSIASPSNGTSDPALQAETTTHTLSETPSKDPVMLDNGSSSFPAALESSTIAIPSNGAHDASNASSESSLSSSPTPAADAATTMGLYIDGNATSTTAMIATSPSDEKECRKGFHRNKKGECELKLKPSSTNALLKLVELSQKLKLRRAN